MDLKTNYLGLELRSPLIPSASPLSEQMGNLRKMEDAGAGAVVLHSLFMEQLDREAKTLHHYLDRGTDSFAESLTYFPTPQEYHLGPGQYMEHVRRAKAAVGIPIIASLNGSAPGTWVKAAAEIEQAGADALELNLYDIPADLETSSPQVEDRYLEVVREVRAVVKLPLAVKVSPYFSAPGQMMKRLVEAGADALVLFNRFYQPDIDLENLEVRPNVLLSTPQALRVPLRWIAILYGRLPASLAATGGIHTGEDALKAFMVGADAAMFCSALLLHGIGHLDTVRSDIVRWMEEHEYESIAQMKGSISQKSCADPTAFERAQYMKAITGYHLPG
jgi:dihydroorotate dehydrogenase (fumarate)